MYWHELKNCCVWIREVVLVPYIISYIIYIFYHNLKKYFVIIFTTKLYNIRLINTIVRIYFMKWLQFIIILGIYIDIFVLTLENAFLLKLVDLCLLFKEAATTVCHCYTVHIAIFLLLKCVVLTFNFDLLFVLHLVIYVVLDNINTSNNSCCLLANTTY